MVPQCYYNCLNPFLVRQVKSPLNNYNVNQMQQPNQKQPTTTEQNFSDNFTEAPGSPTELGTEYTQGYLKTIIGKRVKIFFLIGTNIIQDRDGILTDVGISYVIIRELETNYLILCDIYSIKFVTIYPTK